MSKILNSIFLLLKICIRLILFPIILTLVPCAIFLSLPIFLFRYLVSKTFKIFRPDLSKLVSSTSSMLAADDFHNEPQSNILIGMTIEGNLNINRVRKIFEERILRAVKPSGDLMYPELKQHLTNFCGFFFWKDDIKFDLKHNIKVHTDFDIITEDELQAIGQNLLIKRWETESPLWEILLVNNFRSKDIETNQERSVLLLRFHHSLGDGYSWFTLLFDHLFDGTLKYPKKVEVKRNLMQRLKFNLTFPFVSTWELSGLVIKSLQPSPWRANGVHQKGSFIVEMTDRIPLKKLMDIKSHFKVSFTSALAAVLTGATRDMLIKQNHPSEGVYATAIVVGVPREDFHQLRNYLTAAPLNWPIGETNIESRLQYCSKEFEKVRRLTTPILTSYMYWIVGSYFTCITKLLISRLSQLPSVWLSNFSAGTNVMYFDGFRCSDVYLFTGLHGGASGVFYYAISYADGLRIAPTARSSILSKLELKDLNSLIMKNIDELHRSCKIPDVIVV